VKIIKYYKYIGHNGTITSPIYLDGALKIDLYRLVAEKDKILTNGESLVNSVFIVVDELDEWKEIEKGQN